MNRGVEFPRKTRATVQLERGKSRKSNSNPVNLEVIEEDFETRKIYMLRMYSESGRPRGLGDRAYFKERRTPINIPDPEPKDRL